MPDWGWWLIAALVLVGVEVVTLDLVLGMLAVGALAAAIAALLGAGVGVQVATAAVVALGMLALVRPVALRHLRSVPATRSGTAALLGGEAVVLEPVSRDGGRIKLAGEIWSAAPYDPTAVIPAGTPVTIVRIEGATAVVLET
jgi:membrane protein implicated in regulation of membrane protease activity